MKCLAAPALQLWLVAIAGVARELSPILGDRYAVGLWSQSLPWSLTWFIGSNGTGQTISTGYPTHTFSWTKVAHIGRMSLPSGPPIRSLCPLLGEDCTSGFYSAASSRCQQ
ncbi:hypothetical protein FJTKL_08148 [Diaporthe vaccinii]|uniref:Secreted protein n=1 Tax=Diaporthe vaccinii TaxID=105482 RepID=A0ABR4ESS1_9PEZI